MYNNRWYDQEPACRTLLDQLREIPQPDARDFCGRLIVHFAERLREEIRRKEKKTAAVPQIGATAISGLYRFGKQKRRWYDSQPDIHKGVGMLYTLPIEGLSALGYKLGDTFGLIQIYAMVCHQVDETPNQHEMVRICTTSLQSGRKEAEDVLVSIIGKDLYQSLSSSIER